MTSQATDAVVGALDAFRIELPSWGFANTGTRFGKYLQPAAATTIAEKLSDAGHVHALTGICPTVALHVQWDFPRGLEDADGVASLAAGALVAPGAINPNFFQDQDYKFGSFGNPDPHVRAKALDHGRESIAIAGRLRSRDVSLWFGDGSNYPGTANIRQRKRWFEESLGALHDALASDQRLLIEYKPFEPAFYHTDIADWGMALLAARAAGPRAKVLVDTGHHYQSQNIEQIVAWLLDEQVLGGFHFNDRRYADDDLTLGSIDPYQVFRIFHEIRLYEWERGERADIAYVIDQSHNLKGKIDAMIQTVGMAQMLVARASLVDLARLTSAQKACDLIAAETCLQDAFATDVRPIVREWRRARGLPEDPLDASRQSGYVERITRERAAGHPPSASGATGYA
ncbi:MAG TPA: TIM barrel protein [Vicinamibacterales bacterium]|nr:TIM barrel protein [Vicinamibacterales bacterium]